MGQRLCRCPSLSSSFSQLQRRRETTVEGKAVTWPLVSRQRLSMPADTQHTLTHTRPLTLTHKRRKGAEKRGMGAGWSSRGSSGEDVFLSAPESLCWHDVARHRPLSCAFSSRSPSLVSHSSHSSCEQPCTLALCSLLCSASTAVVSRSPSTVSLSLSLFTLPLLPSALHSVLCCCAFLFCVRLFVPLL